MRSQLFVGRLSVLAVALATAAACSQTPQSPLSPSGTLGAGLGDTASGATLKVNPPIPVSPIGGEAIEKRKPVFVFENSAGRFVEPDQGTYRLELYEDGTLISEIGVDADPSGGTTYEFPNDLEWETTHTWRVRLELDGAHGPWSDMATFLTPDEPKANVPFAIPDQCGPVGNPATADRTACVQAVTQLSPEWARCAAASKVGCFRFAYHVAASLAYHDPRYGMLSKNPGDTQCTWDACGHFGGQGLGEDVVTFLPDGNNPANGWIGWDIIGGAGGSNPSAHWVRLPGRRPGNGWVPVPELP